MSAYSFGVTPITCHAWNGKGDGKIVLTLAYLADFKCKVYSFLLIYIFLTTSRDSNIQE